MSQDVVPGSSEPTVRFGNKELPLSQVEAGARANSRWFYWIAGLSVANSLAAATGLGYALVFGLGITQLVDAVGLFILEEDETLASIVTVFSIGVATVAAAAFVFLGYFAGKLRLWAFVIGMTLYAMDALLFLLIRDWIAFGFHLFVLLLLAAGFHGAVTVNRARATATA